MALQPTPETAPPPPAESSEDQSEPEEVVTRRACRRAAKAAAEKRSKKVQAEALSSILQAKRLNQREAVVDTYRRKGLGAKLCEAEAATNHTGFDSFLNLSDSEVVEEFLGVEPPPTECSHHTACAICPSVRLQPVDHSYRTQPVVCSHPAEVGNSPFVIAPIEPIFEGASIEVAKSSSRPVQTAARARPTKGSNRISAACSKAALASILGKSTRDHG